LEIDIMCSKPPENIEMCFEQGFDPHGLYLGCSERPYTSHTYYILRAFRFLFLSVQNIRHLVVDHSIKTNRILYYIKYSKLTSSYLYII
jgi:hypothetical protein